MQYLLDGFQLKSAIDLQKLEFKLISSNVGHQKTTVLLQNAVILKTSTK